MATEAKERVEEVLSRLPEDYRTVIRIVHLEGGDLRTAATALGRSRDAVRMLYGRAVARFTTELRAAAPGEEEG